MDGSIRIDDDFTLDVYEDEEADLQEILMEEIITRIQIEHNYFSINPNSNGKTTQKDSEIYLLKLIKVPQDLYISTDNRYKQTNGPDVSTETNITENRSDVQTNCILLSELCDNTLQQNSANEDVFLIDEITEETSEAANMQLLSNNSVYTSSREMYILSPDSIGSNGILEKNLDKSISVLNEEQRKKMRQSLEKMLKDNPNNGKQSELTEPFLLVPIQTKLKNERNYINIEEGKDLIFVDLTENPNTKSFKPETTINFKVKSTPDVTKPDHTKKPNCQTTTNLQMKNPKCNKFENIHPTVYIIKPVNYENTVSLISETTNNVSFNTTEIRNFEATKTFKTKITNVLKSAATENIAESAKVPKSKTSNYPKFHVPKFVKCQKTENVEYKTTENCNSKTRKITKPETAEISKAVMTKKCNSEATENTPETKEAPKRETPKYLKVITTKMLEPEALKHFIYKSRLRYKSETKLNPKPQTKQNLKIEITKNHKSENTDNKREIKDNFNLETTKTFKPITTKKINPGTIKKQNSEITKKKKLIGKHLPPASSSSEFQNHPPKKMKRKRKDKNTEDVEEKYQPPKKKPLKTNEKSIHNITQTSRKHLGKVIPMKHHPETELNIKNSAEIPPERTSIKYENNKILDGKLTKNKNRHFIVEDLKKHKFSPKNYVNTVEKSIISAKPLVENIKDTRHEIMSLLRSVKNDRDRIALKATEKFNSKTKPKFKLCKNIVGLTSQNSSIRYALENNPGNSQKIKPRILKKKILTEVKGKN